MSINLQLQSGVDISVYLLMTYTNSSWIRFLMTRLWLAFMVPLNKGEHETLSSSVIINTQEVIRDEMWTVTVWRKGPVSSKIHETVYYVLEPTCEVVGRPAEERLPVEFNKKGPSHRDNTTSRALAMRVDWTSYVENRLMASGFHDMTPPTLLSHLRWTNAEEYEQGISKHWLSRIENEGKLGAYKLKIAQRYILACVVNNRQADTPAIHTIKIANTDFFFSVSGEWMSSSSMAQTASGSVQVPGCQAVHRRKEKPRVNLFLPA